MPQSGRAFTVSAEAPVRSDLLVQEKKLSFPCLAILLSLLIISISLEAGQWAISVGGSSVDDATGMAVDGNGNVYLTGYFSGTSDFDPTAGTTNLTSNGLRDIFIAKYDSTGALKWVYGFGGAGSDSGAAIACDGSGNVYFSGVFFGTVDFDPGAGTTSLNGSANHLFLAKFTSAGALVWAKNFGGVSRPMALRFAPGESELWVVGDFTGSADFNPSGTDTLKSAGGRDIFFAAYNTSGSFLRGYAVGGTADDLCYDAAFDNTVGFIHIVGSFNGTADFDPTASTYNMISAGGTDIYIAQYDGLGNIQWANRMGGSGDDAAHGVAITPDGDIVVVGGFTGTVDFNPGAGTNNLAPSATDGIFFAKYDAAGSYTWAKQISGSQSNYSNKVALDGSGNVYIVGNYINNLDFDPDAGTVLLPAGGGEGVFYAKYNSSGTYQWTQLFDGGGAGAGDGRVILIGASGQVYVAGGYYNTVDFDPGSGTQSLTAAGVSDIFVAKMLSDGTLPVELTYFNAHLQEGRVALSWRTASETENAGFEIQRRLIDNQVLTGTSWEKVGFVAGGGTTSSPHEYFFADKGIGQGSFLYRLKQINRDGHAEYSREIKVRLNAVPASLELSQNYPNPFNPSTTIEFIVPVDGQALLRVFDILGTEVATIARGEFKAGVVNRAIFDASRLSSGAYFARLEFGGHHLTRKITLMQ